MRKILVLFSIALLTITSSVFAGDKDKEAILGKEGVYEEVVQVADVSQADLFKRAKTWILQNMMTDDNNIMFDDKDYTINNNGTLKVDSKTTFSWAIKSGVTNFKFHVWAKDGKYKLRIDNVSNRIILHAGNVIAPKILVYTDLEDSKQGPYLKREIDEKMTAFISAFKSGMTVSAKDKNDW